MGDQPVCGDELLVTKLQTGGEFWTTQAVSAAPAQFPAGVFTGITLENANPPGDPTQGPSGDPSNLVPAGPAGGWCRPPSLPFDQNNPLVSPALWIPAGVLLVGFVVFWLSRGIKIPS